MVPVKGTPAAKSRLAAHPERIRLAEAFAIDTVSALLAAPSVARVCVVTADDEVAERMRALGAEIVREPPRRAPGAPDVREFRSAPELPGLPGLPELRELPQDAPSPASMGRSGVSREIWTAPELRELPQDAPSPASMGRSGVSREADMAACTPGASGTPGAFDALNAAIRQGVVVTCATDPGCNVAVVTGDLPALTVADLETVLALASTHDRSMVADEEGTGTTMLLARAGVPFEPRFGVGSRAAHEAAGHIPLDLPLDCTCRRDVDTVDNLAEALRLGVGRATSALIAATTVISPTL
ncbi:hypothetical protein GCM10027056_25410 [Glaciibacter psychrotolerans]